ncbi:hypothetical protein RN001_009680 [Aquatica leii]|uniref:Regulatory protein zeste n=1 Tax=Aquatica leii TaxID=1421715 RepID=A0AAN7PU07_9COLE|nr:hypothetical protein RN001_009680 [Aquatica leii]
MSNVEKTRRFNFKEEEKSVLIGLINKFKNRIAHKRGDHHSLREKELAWTELTKEYNSHPDVLKRNSRQLKTFYDNFKRRARRNKLDLFKVDIEKPALEDTETQLIINDHVQPLESTFVKDAGLYSVVYLTKSNTNAELPEAFLTDDLATCNGTNSLMLDVTDNTDELLDDKSLVTSQKNIPALNKNVDWKMRRRRLLKKSKILKAKKNLRELSEARKQVIELEKKLMKEKHEASMELIELQVVNENLKHEILQLKLNNYKNKLSN